MRRIKFSGFLCVRQKLSLDSLRWPDRNEYRHKHGAVRRVGNRQAAPLLLARQTMKRQHGVADQHPRALQFLRRDRELVNRPRG